MAKDTKLIQENLLERGYIEKRSQQGTVYFENITGDIEAKVCTDCKNIVSFNNFALKGRGIGGRASRCKPCTNELTRKNREANPEKFREISRKSRAANTKTTRERNRRNYEANPEKYSVDNRKWREANPKNALDIKRRRRARKAAMPNTLTLKQRTSIIMHFKGGCSLTSSSEYVMDHVLPIKCGHGGTTLENAAPLRADLNLSKKDRNIFEWFNDNRERFGLSQAKFDALISYLAEVNGMTTKEYRMYVDWCFDNPRDLETEESA